MKEKILKIFRHIGKNAFDKNVKHQDFYLIIVMFLMMIFIIPFLFFFLFPMTVVFLLHQYNIMFISKTIALISFALCIPWMLVWYRIIGKKMKAKGIL